MQENIGWNATDLAEDVSNIVSIISKLNKRNAFINHVPLYCMIIRGENGFDFSIRTPGTPARWVEFDQEMASAWEVPINQTKCLTKYSRDVLCEVDRLYLSILQTLCDTYCWETYGVMDMNLLEKVRDCILRLTFYWCVFYRLYPNKTYY